MKKISLVILCLALLMTAILPVSAATAFSAAHPKGYSNPNIEHADMLNTAELTKLTEGKDGSHSVANMGTNLAKIAAESDAGDSVYEANGTLSDEQIEALANTDRGLSLIGVSWLRRKISSISDGVWTNGGSNSDLTLPGAGEWHHDGYFYNEYGETQNDTEPNAATGYIYPSLMTYNFKETKQLDYLILCGNCNTSMPGVPQSGDIYVGNENANGEIEWTLHSYWDFPEVRMAYAWNQDRVYSTASESLLGADLKGTSSSNTAVLDLGGVEAQYIRLAFASGKGKTSVQATYAASFNDIFKAYTDSNANISAREFLIIGGEADGEAATPAINYEGVQLSAVSNGTFDARLVASMNSTDYDIAGFEIAARYFDADNKTAAATLSGNAKDHTTKKVYKSVLSVVDGTTRQWTAEGDRCLIAMNVLNIPVSTHLMILTVTPFAEKDGVRTAGETYEVAFLDGVYYATNLVY